LDGEFGAVWYSSSSSECLFSVGLGRTGGCCIVVDAGGVAGAGAGAGLETRLGVGSRGLEIL